METYPNEIAALNKAADSRLVTEAQKSLGRLLTETKRTTRHGVEVPVTTTGVY